MTNLALFHVYSFFTFFTERNDILQHCSSFGPNQTKFGLGPGHVPVPIISAIWDFLFSTA